MTDFDMTINCFEFTFITQKLLSVKIKMQNKRIYFLRNCIVKYLLNAYIPRKSYLNKTVIRAHSISPSTVEPYHKAAMHPIQHISRMKLKKCP